MNVLCIIKIKNQTWYPQKVEKYQKLAEQEKQGKA